MTSSTVSLSEGLDKQIICKHSYGAICTAQGVEEGILLPCSILFFGH